MTDWWFIYNTPRLSPTSSWPHVPKNNKQVRNSCTVKSKHTYHRKSAHQLQSVLCAEICVVWQPGQLWPSWCHSKVPPTHQGGPGSEQPLTAPWGWCCQTPTRPREKELCAAATTQLLLLNLKWTKEHSCSNLCFNNYVYTIISETFVWGIFSMLIC